MELLSDSLMRMSMTMNSFEHRDKRTREITILEGDGWKLQLDNQLPQELKQGKLYTIPEMEYHRLIKGTGKLVVKIWEEKHD